MIHKINNKYYQKLKLAFKEAKELKIEGKTGLSYHGSINSNISKHKKQESIKLSLLFNKNKKNWKKYAKLMPVKFYTL